MFPVKSLVSLILLSLTLTDATPISRRDSKATLGFATKIRAHGSRSIVELDQARAKFMQQGGSVALNLDGEVDKRSSSVNVTDAVVTCIAEVGVGSPATYYTLLIDTGSSNTWVGANDSNAYVRTKTSNSTGGIVVTYGSGEFAGMEYIDTVTLSPDLVILQQSIGVAAGSDGFSGVDGILGVGPVDLTKGTVTNQYTVPTVTDNLFSQGTISEEVLGIYYVPVFAPDSTGVLTFGGVDDSVITSDVNYVPLTKTSPASSYWGIDQSISYGGATLLESTAGTVDSGTTLILIASDAFQTYQSLTGATLDPTTGLLTITPDQYANLQNLTFNIGSQSYDLIPDAQIWPRSLNTAIGGSAGEIYLVVADIGSNTGSGLDFINGYAFLQRYYSVYDTANGQVGFASTAYTNAILN